ncbi:MAG: YhcH/YjgK/YiaL family protein [Acholeplasma sp.]|nr:YhcH/YjgK/YiaL family protein [Acholeplasma sp.]
MIVDHIKNLHKYIALNPNIQSVIDYINQKSVSSITVGKHIINEEVSLIREDYTPKSLIDCYFEAHQQFGDIQWVIKGSELFGYLEKNDSKFYETVPYSIEKDVVKGQSKGDFSKILLTEGMFALVLKDELHMPKLTDHSNNQVIKAVFKIKL